VSDRTNADDLTQENTRPVDDPVFNGLTNVGNLTAAGNNIFLTGYNYKYGFELFVASVTSKPYLVQSSTVTNRSAAEATPVVPFEISVFPNPSHGQSTLYLKGDLRQTGIKMTDVSGKVVWQQQVNNRPVVPLPMDKYPAGVYVLMVTNAAGTKTMKLIKE
jgi:hypothetical protein